MEEINTSYAVRKLTTTDAKLYQNLWFKGLLEFPNAFVASLNEEKKLSLEMIEKRLTGEIDVYGIFTSTTLVGILSLQHQAIEKRKHVGTIWGVYIDRDFRGKHLSKKLMKFVLDEAARNFDQVELYVNIQGKVAIKLYEELGFKTPLKKQAPLNKNLPCLRS